MRTCARSGCNGAAVATLSYDRIALVAYLVDADDPESREPGDLCARHTAKLVLPRQWQLDDRRAGATPPATTTTTATETATEPTAEPVTPAKKLRVVKGAAAPAKPARAKKSRPAARQKWTAPEPSLFDSTSEPAAAVPAARDEPAPSEPVWMPRFADDGELESEVDDRTPLLRRAFGGH